MNRGAQTWDCGELGREEEEQGGLERSGSKRGGGAESTQTQAGDGNRGFSSPRGSALDAALLTRRRQEVLGPAAPGVRASRWDGDGVPDLDSGDWDLSI